MRSNLRLLSCVSYEFFIIDLYNLINLESIVTILPDSSDTQKIQVVFANQQLRMIDKSIGLLGKTRAEVVRNATLFYFSDKSLMSTMIKNKMNLDLSRSD